MFLNMYYQKNGSQKKMGASGASVNKGVGGYRPTINWHDITIRKKNVADKQVLACIVLSGVVIIVIGLIITILGFLVISSQCPFEWVQGSGICFYFAQHNATWEGGKAYCKGQGASLLDLHSESETDFIMENIQGRSWLGLQREKNDMEFFWISGAKMNYSKWQSPAVTAFAATSLECGVVEDTGAWVTSGCGDDDSAYVICEYVPGYNPFVLIGPVVIFCGVLVLILSIEVCIRRREFMEKNPEVMLTEDDDRQVDSGLINYGYGNYEGDEDPPSGTTQKPPTTKTVSWPPVGSSSPTKSQEPLKILPQQQIPGPSTGVQQVTPVEDTGSGPRVHVLPASLPTSPSLAAAPPPDDNTQSQEQLELLLSPKTLE